jgi:hypothetical protein
MATWAGTYAQPPGGPPTRRHKRSLPDLTSACAPWATGRDHEWQERRTRSRRDPLPEEVRDRLYSPVLGVSGETEEHRVRVSRQQTQARSRRDRFLLGNPGHPCSHALLGVKVDRAEQSVLASWQSPYQLGWGHISETLRFQLTKSCNLFRQLQLRGP